jgi:PAS domain S-box-containing protein
MTELDRSTREAAPEDRTVPIGLSPLYSAGRLLLEGNNSARLANGAVEKLVALLEGETVICRGWRLGNDGERSLVLVALPAAEHPSPTILDRLTHEYGLRDELDGRWAAQPLELVRDGDRAMLVLKDAGGEPLPRLLGAPMQVGRFLHLAIGIAMALGKLHERGLIHKDVKPANILVNGATGEVRLTGLGIASRLSNERQLAAPPDSLNGTLAYMAPEQTGRMNRSIDCRSDLYALGVTFYQMLTGVLPFTASDSMEWVHCHLARRPVAPAERLREVPGAVSAIIMKLLAKTTEDRYQTAAGLESDLQTCLTKWQAEHRIDDFPLGAYDTPDRLVIPEKLYGRRREIDALLASFNRVVSGCAPELVMLSGYAGIGKSSVVHELYKMLVPSRALFASGKFDQYKRDIPYLTLAQAFESLIRPLLGKRDPDLAAWREAFREALGPNGRLIVDLVPELSLIIGDQPPVPELPSQDTQGRFQSVLRRFLGVFATRERPLVLFLDDLQWLDSATLDILEDLLTQPDVQHLLLIGAYRDNEVDAAHPLIRKLEAIRTAGAAVTEIILAPLAREDLSRLIGNSLHCEPESAGPLVQVVEEKTAGNPFFAVQFLSTLVEEGLLAFDPKTHAWTWDLEGITAKGFTDNLVDLMVGRLRRLPSSAQNILKLLACLGNNAEAATLEIVLGVRKAEINECLRVAVQSGIIISTEGQYRFLHDRVQEAAYALISDRLRAALHLQVGQRLLAALKDEELAEKIFDIVNQLNLGVPATTDTNEKERIARLNLQAGLRAKASTAYASACSYFAFGLSTLGDQGWERAYEVAFKLVLERAECELLRANLALSGELIELLLSKARSKTDRTDGYRLQVTLQLLRGDMALAVRTALECLKMFDMRFPERPTAEDVRNEFNDLQRQIGSRSIESLLDLPLMKDPEILALSGVLLTLGQSSYFVDEHLYGMLAFRMAKLSIEFGHSSSCILGYGGIGIILGPTFDRFHDGERFARVAVAIAERHGFLAHRPGAYVLLQMASLWTRTIGEALACLDSADKAARETGEVVFACISAEHRVANLLAGGETLGVILPAATNSLTFVQKKGYAHIIDILLAIQHFAATLRGDTSNDSLVGDEATLLQTGLPVVQCYYWILQVQLRYLMGDAAAAIEAAERAKPLLWSARCHIQTGTFRFYYALALFGAMRSVPTALPETFQEQLKASFTALRTLADSAPHTYTHKHTLISAELAGAEGRDLEAMRLYEQAIRAALENGFIQDSAVGAERAADFFARRGLEKIAHSYRCEARELYCRWGASAKVAQLDLCHPDIAPQDFHSRLPTVETSLEHLDLATVIKISQAVSGEIVLANLIDTLMRIAMAHAGAERALLILLRGVEPRVEAEATISGDTVAVHPRDQAVAELLLPVSILQYVLRSRDSVILDDAAAQSPFGEDPYIRQQRVRSILCMPLLNQAKLIGVLYLENNLMPRVFAPARILVLKLLASQAAIALENAHLYRDVAEREAKIRRLVDANIIGIFFWNLEGAIVGANEAFLQMLQYSREDLVSGCVRRTDLTPAEWHARNERALAELKENRSVRPYETQLLRKDGDRVPVLIGGALFEEGGNEGVAFVLDLTEHNRAKEALQESEAKFRDYAETASDWLWEIGPDYKFTLLTENAFGSDPATRIGTTCWDCALDLETEPEKWRRVWAILDARQPFRDFVYCSASGNGSPMYVKANGKPVFDTNGEFRGYRGTGTDVTAIIRAQQAEASLRTVQAELSHVTRVATLGQLTASIAHEITQPIASARNNARAGLNFLDRQPPDIGEVREALEGVVGDADRAGDIIERIRDHIKKAPPQKDCFDLNEAINQVIVLARGAITKNGVVVETRLTKGLFPVLGDRVQVQQVVLNLVLNAVEAMSSVKAEARELLISVKQSGANGVVVAVRDSGPGIDPEQLKRVFDAFYTTKPGGMGMGLSICRSIIDAHGGRLWVDANETRGAVFQFTLPSTQNELMNSLQADHQNEAPREGTV